MTANPAARRSAWLVATLGTWWPDSSDQQALETPTSGWGRRRATTARILLGLVPVALVAGWATADALQPAHYSPFGQSISVTSGYAGTDRWIPTTALLIVGLGFLIAAWLLPAVSRPGRIGLLATAACALGVAFSPEAVTGPTVPHMAFTVIGAVFLALGPLFTLRRGAGQALGIAPGIAQRPVPALIAFALFVALTLWLTVELNAGPAAGLAERLTSSVEVVWPFIVAVTAPVRVEWAT